MVKLGTVQESVLRHLKEHKRWFMGCGWHWNGYKSTEKIMQSLMKKGLVKVDGFRFERTVYVPVEREAEAPPVND